MQREKSFLPAGSVFGAVVAVASCCVLPVLLAAVGIGGAWMGTLASLEPYQPAFVTLGAVCFAAGFWQTWRAPSRRWTRAVLWVAAVIVGLTVRF